MPIDRADVCCSVPQAPNRARSRRLGVYLELSKARLSALVLATAVVGFVLASDGPLDASVLLWTAVGTAMCAGGANAWNQWLEVKPDSRMQRTRRRPLPTGRIGSLHALAFAVAMVAGGAFLLAVRVNGLTALLALLAAAVYVLAYTPLKARSTLCTLVGAMVGAIPPLMGWAAATGRLDKGAWILAAVLFVWQIPHFLSLAWLYREDYRRGGFRMLPLVDPSGRLTCLVSVLYSAALLPIGLAATVMGVAGWTYAAGSCALAAGMGVMAVRLFLHPTEGRARQLFVASLIYLPLLLTLLLADRGPSEGRTLLAFAAFAVGP